MKQQSRRGRIFAVAFCIAALTSLPLSSVYAGSLSSACVLSPTPCLRSLSLAKSAPTGMGLWGLPGGSVTLVFTLTATCPSCPATLCAAPVSPTNASVSVNFYPAGTGSCPVAQATGLPAFSFNGPVATPACSPNGAFATYAVVVPVPATATPGNYCAYGTVTVSYSDGMILTAGGDTTVSIVEPVPGDASLPRLSLTLLSPSAPRLAPGDGAIARYSVRNNDPSKAVTLMAIAASRQIALRPQGANERQGVFTISNPFGDDFPIQLNPTTNCIPLPPHPYSQPALSNVLAVIPPGGSNVVTVAIRSYGQCANGSCSESTLKVAGTFSDGSPVFACAGMALVVDTSVPSTPCALSINDCNHNGIPDALDIARGTSQDRNFNAIPDECEQFISVPFFSSISPTNPSAGQPIQVQVAFNEVVPMQNVWADGIPLVRTQVFSSPFWTGTIPADTRPGPQTVYFLGRDQIGNFSTFIAPYQVVPPLRITRIYLDAAHNAIVEHNGAQAGPSIFVQENPDLSCLTCWTNRPNGPHTSPHNAGPANATRFFRLRK